MEKFKCFLVILILLVVGFGIWFFFIKEDKDVTIDDSNPDYDMSDVTNVPVIDRKLGNDIEITQSYLMTYTVHKAGIWYMSEGYVSNVKVSNQSIIYTISNEDNSKSDYLDNSVAGNYFLLSMDESFNYTGNANVTLKCNINGTYNLRNCSLVQ